MTQTFGMPFHVSVRGWLYRAGLLMLAAAMVLPIAAKAQQTSAENEAEGWQQLKLMQEAARKVDYSGVFTWQQGDSLQSSRIVHIVDGTGERERVELLDGVAREFIRHNDVVQCLVPEKKLVLIEKQRIHRFPSIMLKQDANLEEHYDVSVGTSSMRVAGRTCTLIDIKPKDTIRYGQRLCVDEENHLLLKAQTLDTSGRVIDQVAFIAVRYGDQVQVDQLSSAWDISNWKVVQTVGEEVNVEEQGWRIPAPLGFQYISQMSRPIRSGQPLTHLVMSDGMSAISVFIEPVSEHPGSHSVQSRSAGAMSIHGLRVADYWLTLVGEVPLSTLKTLAAQVEYVPPSSEPK